MFFQFLHPYFSDSCGIVLTEDTVVFTSMKRGDYDDKTTKKGGSKNKQNSNSKPKQKTSGSANGAERLSLKVKNG